MKKSKDENTNLVFTLGGFKSKSRCVLWQKFEKYLEMKSVTW